MQAYIPPHRRQQTPASIPQSNQLKTTAFMDGGLAGRCDRLSWSDRRVMSSCGVLLQAHGDSFVGPLTQLKEDVVDVRRYSGATAKGLDNDQSSQKVGQRLVTCLDNTRPAKVKSFAPSFLRRKAYDDMICMELTSGIWYNLGAPTIRKRRHQHHQRLQA